MSLWLWRLPSRLMFTLRCLSMALVVFALCGLCVRAPVRSGTVVLVADRSLSMPPGSDSLQTEAADIIHSTIDGGDKMAVVSFAERAAVEQSPQTSKFTGFSAEVGREASHLSDALELGLSLIGRDDPGRLLVISDGRWTGRDLTNLSARAAAAGVPVDYRLVERAGAGDLAVQRIQGPESVLPGESFMISAWIDSPLAQPVTYELVAGEQVIAQGKQNVPAGTSRLVFRDKAVGRGVGEYVLRIQGEGTDPVPENNRARLLVGIHGARPLLCITQSGQSGLADLLARGGLNVESRAASRCKWTLEELSGYSGILLENSPAGLIGHVGLQNLAAWVSQSGGGLMCTGGKDSYGPGGYYKSPLERIIPVSMELRREHHKFSLAIVVALDRSGSMMASTSDGRVKMDLANLATAEVVDMLGAMDQFGCTAVDSIAHEIVPLSDVTNKAAMRNKVLSIASQGGGIFVYEALSKAASMIAKAKAGTKHIILFADAQDSEEPGDYKNLVEKCVKAGITISVVGLGSAKDCDAGLLKDVARRGGGQCMFTNVAEELPRLFAQDTFLIARSSFLEDPVAVRSTGGLVTITSRPLGKFPDIGGYNLCYHRSGANLAAVSVDEYNAPIVSSWQSGLGRVICYTGEADGEFTGSIADWKNAGEFFASLARWTAGKSQGLAENVVATQELRNGVCRIELHLDPDRERSPFERMPELTALSALPGSAATSNSAPMHWATADTLIGEIPLSGSETILATVAAPGMGQTTLAPMCLPYSPEYMPEKRGRGAAALEQLAKATGGVQRLNLGSIWEDIPKTPRLIPLAPYLLLAAVVLFLLEVLQRRTGLLTVRPGAFGLQRLKLPVSFRRRTSSAGVGRPKSKPKRGTRSASLEEPAAEKEPVAKPRPAKQEPEEKGMFDALNRAQQRARSRTKRD